MTHQPTPSETPRTDRMFETYVSDPKNNGDYVLNLNKEETEELFRRIGTLERELAEANKTIEQAADDAVKINGCADMQMKEVAALRAQLQASIRESDSLIRQNADLREELQGSQKVNEELVGALQGLIAAAEMHKRMADALAHIDRDASLLAAENLERATAALAHAEQGRGTAMERLFEVIDRAGVYDNTQPDAASQRAESEEKK